jgi:exodeoxyribonuclease VII small subunit
MLGWVVLNLSRSFAKSLRPTAHLRYNRVMAKKTQAPPKGFEEAIAELEQILSQMESSQVALEESLAKYERGTFLIRHCRGVLAAAEKQIELLSKADDGSLQAETAPEEQGA